MLQSHGEPMRFLSFGAGLSFLVAEESKSCLCLHAKTEETKQTIECGLQKYLQLAWVWPGFLSLPATKLNSPCKPTATSNTPHLALWESDPPVLGMAHGKDGAVLRSPVNLLQEEQAGGAAGSWCSSAVLRKTSTADALLPVGCP